MATPVARGGAGRNGRGVGDTVGVSKRIVAGVGAAAAGGALALRRRRAQAPGLITTNGEGPAHTPRVVVAGAGFAGVTFVRELRRQLGPDLAEVSLIDQHNYHLFTPLLYQVATGSVDASH